LGSRVLLKNGYRKKGERKLIRIRIRLRKRKRFKFKSRLRLGVRLIEVK
jgi:hypothetical protein